MNELGLDHDSKIYNYNIIEAMGDRPMRLGDAPPPNGYLNWGSFA
jgi:hypothetical protein